jgi:hypothetical protein
MASLYALIFLSILYIKKRARGEECDGRKVRKTVREGCIIDVHISRIVSQVSQITNPASVSQQVDSVRR